MSFADIGAGGPLASGQRGGSQAAKGSQQDSTQGVATRVFQVATAVSHFQRFVNTLDTSEDTPELREKLQKTSLYITQLVKETSAKLKQATETDHHAEVSASKKIADAKLAKDFGAILREFQKAQQVAAEKKTTYAPFVPQAALSSRHKTRNFITQLVKDTSAKLSQATSGNKKIADAKLTKNIASILREFQKPQWLAAEKEIAYAPVVPQADLPSRGNWISHQLYITSEIDVGSDKSLERHDLLVEAGRQKVLLLDNEIGFNEAIIEERDQGIQEIQQQIEEVNEIFKDLAILVRDQGTIIDDFQTNIERSHAVTAEANIQLVKASKSQRSNSSLACFLMLIFGFALLIPAIILAA